MQIGCLLADRLSLLELCKYSAVEMVSHNVSLIGDNNNKLLSSSTNHVTIRCMHFAAIVAS